MNANLYALLRDHFPRTRRSALHTRSGRSGHPLRRARRGVGAHRRRTARRGLHPGDRVAVQVDKCWEALALYLACLRAGFVYLPLNTGYQKGELPYFFDDAEPRVIVGRPGRRSSAGGAASPGHRIHARVRQGDAARRGRDQDEVFDTVRVARRTTWRRFSIPRARPGAPRARCSPIAILPATR